MNIEIRRIREADADSVVSLWDRMNREVPDGGPLTAAGRRNLSRMLAVASWHRETFCLVAVRGDEVLGFGVGRVDAGDGLLPFVAGQIHEVYAAGEAPETLRGRLADAVTAELKGSGVTVLRTFVAADDPAGQRFWADRRFEADMVVMTSYQP